MYMSVKFQVYEMDSRYVVFLTQDVNSGSNFIHELRIICIIDLFIHLFVYLPTYNDLIVIHLTGGDLFDSLVETYDLSICTFSLKHRTPKFFWNSGKNARLK